MSNTKNTAIDDQSERREQQNPLLGILQTDKAVASAATVGESHFWRKELPLPAVYVQGTERAITATDKAEDIDSLTKAVVAALTKNGRTAQVSPVYGDVAVTRLVWQVIDTQPI